MPLSGGAASVIYNATGSKCGNITGDGVSGGSLAINEFDISTDDSRVIAVKEVGPANQTPNVLADGGVDGDAEALYSIDGRFWIFLDTFDGTNDAFSTVVTDSSGSVVQHYTNTLLSNDVWHGFDINGASPQIQRDFVYLFSPNVSNCSGGTLTAVNPASFTMTGISGVPADTCRFLADGWAPMSVGRFQEVNGSSAIEVDPVGGKAYQILGIDPNGGEFGNVTTLSGYPFF
jgi:hypothetical protein